MPWFLAFGRRPYDILVDCPFKRTLDELGTQYGSYEVNKEEDGDIMMNVVSAVTGNRMVSPSYF
jgi:hypothetical protein